MTKVEITTTVDLDVSLLAKTFAHLGNDEQAEFFAKVWQEMGKWGGVKRTMQCDSIREKVALSMDAKVFLEELEDPNKDHGWEFELSRKREPAKYCEVYICASTAPDGEKFETRCEVSDYALDPDDPSMNKMIKEEVTRSTMLQVFYEVGQRLMASVGWFRPPLGELGATHINTSEEMENFPKDPIEHVTPCPECRMLGHHVPTCPNFPKTDEEPVDGCYYCGSEKWEHYDGCPARIDLNCKTCGGSGKIKLFTTEERCPDCAP